MERFAYDVSFFSYMNLVTLDKMALPFRLKIVTVTGIQRTEQLPIPWPNFPMLLFTRLGK